MNNYKHILAMRDGVIIAADDNKHIAAIVNGKAYRTTDYRPIDEDGRQLRADNQYTIQQLLPIARDNYNKMFSRPVVPSTTGDGEAEKLHAELSEALQDAVRKDTEIANLKAELNALKASRPSEPKKHKCFDKCLYWLKNGLSPYLYGPAGTGKSFLSQQLAEALGCERFEQLSGVCDAITDLTGYTDANGNYQSTAFYRVWKNGGLLLIDEMDTSVSQELTRLNNAMANKQYCFPEAAGGMIKMHPNCYIIGAGNTIMRGADAEYTGREALDLSTCDRFIPVPCNYDREIEMQLSHNDVEFVEFLHEYRKAFKTAGVSTLATYRAIRKICVTKQIPDTTLAEALRYGLTGTLSADDVHYIINSYTGDRSNNYFIALQDVVELLRAEEKEAE